MKVLKKIGKFFMYFFGVVILLLLIVSIAIDPIAKNIIERQVNEYEESQYTLKLKDVNISLLSGNIILEGIVLQTDASKAREEEVPVVYMEAGEISTEGISWLKFLFTKELYIDRISLLNIKTELKVRTMDNNEETKPFTWNQLDIYPDLKEHIDRIRLKDLRFNYIDLTLINIESADTLLFSASEFNLNSDDILIDADKVFTDTRAFYASQIDLEGKDIEIRRSGNSEWDLDFDLVYVDTREEDLSLLSENMVFFNSGNTVNDTLIFAGYSKFEINDIELNALRTDSIANIRNLVLHNLNILTYLDVEEELESEEPEQQKNRSIDLPTFSLGESLPEFVHQINIEEIDLQNFSYNQNYELVVQSFNLESHKFRLDRTPAFSGNRFLHSEHFKSSVHGLKINDAANYLINLKNFNIDIENGKGSFQLNDLSVKPLQNQTSETSVHLHLHELLVSQIDVTELTTKVLKIDSIAINNPIIKASMAAAPVNEAEESNAIKSLYPFISNFLANLYIRKVAFIKGDIEVERFGEQQQDIRLPVVYVQVSDLNIAEGNAFAGRRVFHADDIAVRLEDITYSMPDNIYKATLALVRMSTREKFFSINNFSYSFNNYKQLLKAPESNQVYTVKGDRFLISNLEFQDIIKSNGFFASRILLEGIETYVYKDNNYPEEESENKVYPNPQAMIMDIGMPLYVGEFNLNNGSLTYKEMAEGGEDPGVFTTDKLNVSLKNLSNNRNILKNNPETSLNISTKLMGTGLLEIQVKIPMLDPNQPVLVSGSLDTLDLTKLNDYTEYTTIFGIESGTIYKLLWDFETSNGMAHGKFGLSYENLNIQLSEAESPDTGGTLNTIGSYLANVLVLDEDIAEGKSEKPETAKFKREKDEEEGFIEHYINSLMAGFVEVMGFPLSIIDP